jgi:hypothetical protein
MIEGDWVPANIAREMLKQATGLGPEVLASWAATGALRSRAAVWERDWRWPEEDVELPRIFWSGKPLSRQGDELAEFGPVEWASGDFRCIVQEQGLVIEGRSVIPCHLARMVSFSVDDLSACIAGLKRKANAGPKENKPRLPDAALNAWFANLGSDADNKSQPELLQLCRAAHPNNSIARDRVRAKTQGRKRGPKPNSR